MVRIEHKRSLLVFHIGDLKIEWVIEPRYWRNHLIAVFMLVLLTTLVSVMGRMDVLTLITTANI